jgi:hypothetical protein
MALFGVWITLLGYRVVGYKPGENVAADRWSAKNGWLFRIGGPILIIGSLSLGVLHLLRTG